MYQVALGLETSQQIFYILIILEINKYRVEIVAFTDLITLKFAINKFQAIPGLGFQ